MTRVSLVVSLVVIAMAGGCMGIAKQHALTEATPQVFELGTKPVAISVEIVDERPADERSALRPASTAAVPLFPLLTVFSSQGQLRPASRFYAGDSDEMRGDLARMVSDSLTRSGLVSPKSQATQTFRLRVTIHHLYGITYSQSTFVQLLAGVSTSNASFAPYGFAAATVELIDSRGGVVGHRTIAVSQVPLDEDIQKMTSSSQWLDQLSEAAVAAAATLVGEVTSVAELLLAEIPAVTPIDVARTNVFYISRHVPDGVNIELVGVDYNTGKIVSNRLIERGVQPYAQSNTWVVDPYFGSQTRLTTREYGVLIERLRARYDVRYITDVRVARFLGRLPGASVDDELPESLSRLDIKRTTNELRGEMRACQTQHPAAGNVTVDVEVAPSGAVVRAEIASAPDDGLSICVAAVVQRTGFPATRAGGKFHYTWKF